MRKRITKSEGKGRTKRTDEKDESWKGVGRTAGRLDLDASSFAIFVRPFPPSIPFLIPTSHPSRDPSLTAEVACLILLPAGPPTRRGEVGGGMVQVCVVLAIA